MSYHILHQFDEQWLAELDQRDAGKNNDAADHTGYGHEYRRRLKPARDGHRWAIITAAVLLATFALLFAIDATQRAESLQQRLDAVERQVSGLKLKA